MNRNVRLLWMKDLLDHLADCCEQYDAADDRTERYLVESMKRDLDEFRRLCDTPAEGQRLEAACV